MRVITSLAAIGICMAVLATAHAQEVYRPGNGVTTPTVVKDVKPQYTEKARAAGIQGLVELTVVVGMDGLVSDVRVTEPLDDELDQQAVEAMRQWTFKPGTKDGKPVAVRVDVQMTFTLK